MGLEDAMCPGAKWSKSLDTDFSIIDSNFSRSPINFATLASSQCLCL